jgi:uncharacterized ferredoxin-like protein
MPETTQVKLPGLDCGLCGFKHCEELERELVLRPELLKRCIQISDDRVSASASTSGTSGVAYTAPPPANPAVASPSAAR